MSTATPATSAMSGTRTLPPVLGRLLSGTFWLALRVPLQVVFSLWTTRLVLEAIGPDAERGLPVRLGIRVFPVPLRVRRQLGVAAADLRRLDARRPRGGRSGDRLRDELLRGDGAPAGRGAAGRGLLGAAAHARFEVSSYPLVVKLLWLQAVTAPCFGISVVVSSVLQAARRYDFVPRFELAITVLRFVVLVLGVKSGFDFFWVVAAQTAVQVGLGSGAGPVGDGPRAGPLAPFPRVHAGPTTRRWGISASTSP